MKMKKPKMPRMAKGMSMKSDMPIPMMKKKMMMKKKKM